MKAIHALSALKSGSICAGSVEEVLTDWGRYSSRVSSAQQKTIDQLAALIVTSFDQSDCPPYRTVRVVGHADKDAQGPKLEETVSFQRANTVQSALTRTTRQLWEDRKMGPPPPGGVEWSLKGMGAKQMIAPPYHAKNRRVVVTLVRSGLPIPHKPAPTVFTPGIMHDHRPSNRWAEVQANPNSPGASFLIIRACKIMSPREFANAAVREELLDKPIAFAHAEWYLHEGQGRDFVEDEIIKLWLQQDRGIQTELDARIPRNRTTGIFTTHFNFSQDQYVAQDFMNAFGSIDRVDVEVDFDAGTLHVWFQDRYEWHPFYPGLYAQLPGDHARPTNCVHAAFVELKNSGAADFWMKGEATLPLKSVLAR